MSDRVKLAREIAARTKPRFIDDTTASEGTKDLKALRARLPCAAKRRLSGREVE